MASGTISSGTGLISGLDISSIVSQLMQIESRSLNLLKTRITKVTAEQTAFSAISAQLLAAKSSINSLAKSSAYTVRSASSSNTSVLTASATSKAALGNYSFQVKSLVTTHQLISNGFTDRDTTAIGTGSLTFKVGQGYVDTSTSLSALNGLQGVRAGVIRITDRSGTSAEIDLRSATTIQDVLDTINNSNSINVQASVKGDALVIEDQTGLGSGTLIVADIGGGYTAKDLGIAGSSSTGRIEGTDLVRLSETIALSQLNDGIGFRYNSTKADMRITLSDGTEFNVNLSANLRFSTAANSETGAPAIPSTYLAELNNGSGVRRGTDGALQIRITNRAGQSGTIDLSSAETIDDIKELLNNAVADDGVTSLNVKLSGMTSSSLIISDSSGGTTSNLKIENVAGAGYAATDLGLVADTDQNTVTGKGIYSMTTLGAVMRAIRYAEDTNGNANDGRLQVAISADGNGLVFTDTTGGAGTATVEALNDSWAMRDLGLANGVFDGDGTLRAKDIIAGLNTVLLSSLNGGQGISTGILRFQLRDTSQSPVELDFTGDQTLQDVLDRINATGTLSARVDAGGLGIAITDLTSGSGTFGILNDAGTGEPPRMAVDLGLALNAEGELASSDLHRQYVSENSLLSELNFGKGITYGKMTIQDSRGGLAVITLNSSLHKTVGDVLKEINSQSAIQVQARINATGDGIELVDLAEGGGTLLVGEVSGGTTAASLGLNGTVVDNVMTGSFTKVIEIEGDDTLDDLVTKINKAGVGVTASVLNDGSSFAPYRMVLGSNTTGSAGRIAFSLTGSAVTLNTLTKAQDAVVVVGDPDSSSAIVVKSSSNTLTNVVDGVTLNLIGTSSSPVTLTVGQDIDKVVTDINSFISSFNNAMSTISSLTSYNSATETKGVLLGDSTVSMISSQLYRLLMSNVDDETLAYKRLSSVGITVESGAKLSLDEDKFREAFAKNPEAVTDLFTKTRIEKGTNGKKDTLVNVGMAAKLNELLNTITTSLDGTIARKSSSLQDKIDMMNDRAEYMQEMLDRKEERLYAQYQAMETALANLQTQSSSLSGLSDLVSSLYS